MNEEAFKKIKRRGVLASGKEKPTVTGPVTAVTGLTGGDRFGWFLKNRPVQIQIFENLQKFVTKISKKTRAEKKIYGEKTSRKYSILHATKIGELKTKRKKIFF